MKVLLALAIVLGAGGTRAVHLRERRLGVVASGGAETGLKKCVAFFDQGGGSFTGFLFDEAGSETGKELAKIKSKDIVGTAGNGNYKPKTIGASFTLTINDGTFNDYSGESEMSNWGGVTKALAEYYKEAADKMVAQQSYNKAPGKDKKSWTKAQDPVCELAGVIVRQTGKIRETLLTGKLSTHEDEWNNLMKLALRDNFNFQCNYALLKNTEEADLEGTDFFDNKFEEFNIAFGGFAAKDKVLALGVGSSSTQAYFWDGSKVKALGDSELGVKPTEDKITEGAIPSAIAGGWGSAAPIINFEAKFTKLFNGGGKDRTIVAMNGIGYAIMGCLNENKKVAGKKTAKLINAVNRNMLISPDALMLEAESCFTSATAAHTGAVKGTKDKIKAFTLAFQAGLLHGLAAAAKKAIAKGLVLECKFDKKCAIPGGAGWVSPLVSDEYTNAVTLASSSVSSSS